MGEPTCWQCTCLVALEFKPARRGIPSKAHVGLFRLLTNSYVIHAYSQTASSQRSQLATCLFPGGCCMESSFHIFEQMKRSSAEVRMRWLAPTLCVSSGIPTSTAAHLVFLGVQKQMIEISLPLPDLKKIFLPLWVPEKSTGPLHGLYVFFKPGWKPCCFHWEHTLKWTNMDDISFLRFTTKGQLGGLSPF